MVRYLGKERLTDSYTMKRTGIVLANFIAVCFAAGAGLAHAQSGQPAEPIEWSNVRKLRKSDFKGIGAMQSQVAARSFISIQASWSCDGDRLDAKIRALFDPSRSTWSGPSAAVAMPHPRGRRVSAI